MIGEREASVKGGWGFGWTYLMLDGTRRLSSVSWQKRITGSWDHRVEQGGTAAACRGSSARRGSPPCRRQVVCRLYLAGYAVECGLKACVAKLTNLHDFPDKQFAANVFTHDINKLVEFARLRPQLDSDIAANQALRANWGIAKDWSEKARYQQNSEALARSLFQAVIDNANGVLPWIKSHW